MSQLVPGLNTLTTSGTYTLPTNANCRVSIEMFGGGGAGGGGYPNGTNGGGGGGAGGERKIVSSEVISGSLDVTVGTGGTGGKWARGRDGTSTSVKYTPVNGSTTTLTAAGGSGGVNAINNGNGGVSSEFNGGRGGRKTVYESVPPSSGIGAVNSHGYGGNGNDQNTLIDEENYYTFGGGGGGYNGSGGNGANALNTTNAGSDNGENGVSYGGGGGGATREGIPGNGANGVVIINITSAPTITATVDTTTTSNHFIVTATPTTGLTIEPVTSYTMTVTPPLSTGLTPITYTGVSPIHNFSGVYSGIYYTITVVAHSELGDSNTVTLSEVYFEDNNIANNPAPAYNIVATPGPGYRQITLSFNNSPSFTVSEYLIHSTPDIDTDPVSRGAGLIETKIFSDLTIDQDYTFKIKSINDRNDGSTFSLVTSPVKPLNIIPPVITPLTAGDGTLEVNFTPATQPTGITVTGYSVSLSPGNASQTIDLDGPYTANFTGLTNGETYTATVTVITSSGSINSTATGVPIGPPTITATVDTTTTPNHFIVTATRTTGSVTSYTMTVTPPESIGLTSITYTGAEPIHNFSGVYSGINYTITVVAHSELGDSNTVTLSNVRFADNNKANNPASAYNIVATPGPGYRQITLSFNNSPSDTVYDYLIVSTPSFTDNHRVYKGNGLSETKIYSNLTIDEPYTFVIKTMNNNGSSTFSSPTSPVKPLNIIPPVITPLTAGDGTLEVNFTPATQPTGITITGYSVSLSPGNASQTIVRNGPYTANFTGLTNGVTYTATVTVITSSGSINSTATGVPNGPLPVPNITDVKSSSNGELNVTFNPVTGATSYVAQAYLNGSAVIGATGTVAQPNPIASSTINITNLVQGAFYQVKIKAIGSASVDDSAYSALNPITAVQISGDNPPEPSNIRVTSLTTNNIDITFDSVPTIRYQLSVNIPNNPFIASSAITTATSTTTTLTLQNNPLTLNTSYQYWILIYKKGGYSQTSTVPFTTLNVLPPTNVAVTPGNGQLTVDFTKSLELNQTNHTVEILDRSNNVVGTQTFTNPTSPQSVIFNAANTNPELINGVQYTAKVTVNATAGSSSVTSTGTPNGPPAPATNVNISPSETQNQLVVNYTLSASESSYITGYDVILTPNKGSALSPINVSNTANQVIVNSTNYPSIRLISGMSYSAIVRAKSANGSTDSASASGTPTGDAEPATITSVDADNKKITINFNASATPSEHLESYIVVLTPFGGSDLRSDPIPVTSASTYSYAFEGLTNYVEHTAKVITKGNANLVKSTEINSNTLKASTTGPDAPTNVRAEPDQGKAFVYFEPSVVPEGGSLIKEYTATSSPSGFTASGSASPLLVEGLSNGTEYTFTVVAKNNLEKVSVASEPSLGVTPTSVPDAPTLVSAVAGDGKVTITFTTPFDGGSEIREYSVFSVQNGVDERSLPAFSSPFVYDGLVNGQKYTFSVCANNAKGSSENSNSLDATPASLEILDILNTNSRIIPDVSIFMNSIDALDIAERGDLVRFADLGVNFSALTTNDHKKKITKKLANLLFQEKSHLKHFKVKKSSFPIVSSNAKDDIIVVKANDEPFELEMLDSTTSIYVGIENLGDHNTFIIGSDEFTIVKTANGYDFIYNNTTTSHIDGAETRVNDLLIVFGGGSISFDPFNQALPCYARGTLIGTSRGWVPIENLLISDKLRTYDRIEENMFKPVHGSPFKTLVRVKDTRYKNKFGDIKFIGKFTVDMMHENTAPIRITAGSLGPSKPEIDLLVSPNHSMLIGNRLIFAKFLVNGSTIYQDMSFKKIEYFHVLSDNHYIINANGALSETLGSEELGLFHSLNSCSDKIENIDIKDNGMLAY